MLNKIKVFKALALATLSLPLSLGDVAAQSFEQPLSLAQIESLVPVNIADRSEVVAVAQQYAIQNLIPMDAGIMGKVNSNIVFIASKKDIPDNSRLYWAMVRVLSERFGCFMTKKISDTNKTKITCRDKRQVVFNYGSNDKLIFFSARQYDKHGKHLVVKNHIILAQE